MKKRMIVAAALVAVGVLAGVTAQRVRAEDGGYFNPLQPFGTPYKSGTGMIGVVPGQTVRLNAVNIGVPANACNIDLTILDSTGNPLTRSASMTLMPGAATHLDFSPPPATLLARTQVRTLVALADVAGNHCAILPTVEVFDHVTLRTSIAMSGDPSW